MSDPLATAVQHHRAGRVQEAEALYRQVVAEQPDHLAAGVNLGHLLLATRRPEEAIACFDRVLGQAPAQPDALFGRGAAHAALQRYHRAEADFRALLTAQPDHAGARSRLGGALIKQARMAEAVEVLRDGRARHPDNAGIAANLASALEALNDLESAEAAAQAAQALTPEAPGPRILLARLDHRHGRLVEARAGLESALASQPNNEARCDALFELGQVLDKLGEASAALTAFREANELQVAGAAARRLDGDRFLARIAANRAAFAGDGLAELSRRLPEAPNTPAPVFFVGFPRSGTTLVERALAAHPGLVTTEERSPLAPAVRHLIGPGGTPAALDDATEAQFAEARAIFWQAAKAVVGPLGDRLLIDKLPLNIVDLGYARLLFPGARVLVALRDPRDACLSAFMQRFRLDDSMINFTSLERTAETYAGVMGLWLDTREDLGLPWHEFRYEDLVDDFETGLRALLAFLGLDWDPAVIEERQRSTERAVSTPSYRQVARPIYRESLGRWRAYAEAFAPLQASLAPFVKAFGYEEG